MPLNNIFSSTIEERKFIFSFLNSLIEDGGKGNDLLPSTKTNVDSFLPSEASSLLFVVNVLL